jgi:hypothetical protein
MLQSPQVRYNMSEAFMRTTATHRTGLWCSRRLWLGILHNPGPRMQRTSYHAPRFFVYPCRLSKFSIAASCNRTIVRSNPCIIPEQFSRPSAKSVSPRGQRFSSERPQPLFQCFATQRSGSSPDWFVVSGSDPSTLFGHGARSKQLSSIDLSQ